MNWIKVPVRFVKSGEPDYNELGINVDVETDPGEMLINLERVDSINETDDGQQTVLRFNGVSGDNCIWVQMKFKEFEKLLIK